MNTPMPYSAQASFWKGVAGISSAECRNHTTARGHFSNRFVEENRHKIIKKSKTCFEIWLMIVSTRTELIDI